MNMEPNNSPPCVRKERAEAESWSAGNIKKRVRRTATFRMSRSAVAVMDFFDDTCEAL